MNQVQKEGSWWPRLAEPSVKTTTYSQWADKGSGVADMWRSWGLVRQM